MKEKSNKHLKHWIVWITYSLGLYFIFSNVTDDKTALIHSMGFIGNQLIVFYFNLHVLIPKLYEKQRYLYYALINISCVIIAAWIHDILEEISPELHKATTKEVAPQAFHFDPEPFLAHSMPIVVSIFAAFLIFSYNKHKQQKAKELEAAKAEKDFLIQQINPHFLFNSLNNIYALSMQQDPKTSEAILQLSSMLDYSLYGNKKDWVSLTSEMDYIRHFIGLYHLRDDEIQIGFHTAKAQHPHPIAPMLLLPFVENAFKHGNIEDTENGSIEITIRTDADHIYFCCYNTYTPKKSVDKTGGIGIQNVSRRLELLYPSQYEIDIQHTETDFEVNLKILVQND